MTASVLVVEDEPSIQELVAVNLVRHGHEVKRAANAEEAYRAVAETLPDVILLDWMLPDSPGPAITRRLRGDARTREVPIIMLTARAGEDDKVAGLEAGADDYITKPFSPRELEARIQAVLRRRAPQLSREAVEIEGLVLNPAMRTVSGSGKALRMSPANVYRFFDSKKSIHEGVACSMMGGVEDAAQAIAAKPGSAASRLRELVTTIHRMNSERYVGDSKLHEMVEIAMEESWQVCVAHMQRLTETIAQVIAEGAAAGEFDAPDVPLAATCACTAMMRFFHPQMIAQAVNKPGPSLDQMVDFILVGLAARGGKPGK